MEIIFKYVKEKSNQLNQCPKTFEALFNIIHDQGDRIFLEYLEMYQKQVITYKQTKDFCLKMASYLQPKLTSKQGSFVGIYMENSLNWVGCFWSLLMIGYKPLLLNCRLPSSINNDILKTMNVSEVVTTSEYTGLNLDVKFVYVLNQNQTFELPIKFDAKWEDEIGICSTASSLNYKICVYDGKNMAAQLQNASDIIRNNPRIKKHYKHRLKLLAFLPFYHIFGLFAGYLWFSLFGRTFVLLNDYSADTIINTIQFFDVTHIFAVPLFWNNIAKQINKEIERLDSKTKKKIAKAQERCLRLQNIFPNLGLSISRRVFKQIVNRTLGHSINFLISGGGYISDQTLHLLNSIGYPLVNGYGTTEVGIISVETRRKSKNILSGSTGRPFKSIETKIEQGNLCCKGLSTCKYFINKDGSRVDLNNNWYNTNDIASIENGNLFINGRYDDVFVGENGEKINPDLIEKRLILNLPENYSILSLDNKLTLIIQISKYANTLYLEKLIKEVNDNLQTIIKDGYSLNNIYFTYDYLAPASAIKVSRKQLTKQINEQQVKLYPFSELKTLEAKTEKELNNEIIDRIKTIFSQVLNKPIESIGINQHFIFDLNGTSLDYFTCLIRLQKEFDLIFNFKTHSCSTVYEFSNYILNTRKEDK